MFSFVYGVVLLTIYMFSVFHRLAVDPWLRVVGGDGSVLALGDCACNAEDVLPATAQVAGQQGEWLGKMCRRG